MKENQTEIKILIDFITQLKKVCDERSCPLYKEVDGDVYVVGYHNGTIDQIDIDNIAERFGVEVK